MPDAVNARTDLVQIPPGTPTGFPVAQVFSEERAEFHTPFADRFMADHNAAPVQQFLNVAVAQWEAVIEPDGLLDDGHGETVAVGFRVGHGESGYPNPFKATQPSKVLDLWAYEQGVTLDLSRPGKPQDSAHIKSFNSSFRDECLNAHWFLA